LFSNWVIAIVPPSNPTISDEQEVLDAIPVMGIWVQGVLLGLAGGLILVFGIAAWLRPYHKDGAPKTIETHRDLGLPPCSFYAVTRYPCPACGMTTSFALLMHGDLVNSLRANWAGTILAVLGLLFIPWSVASVFYRRTLFIRSVERTVTILMLSFMTMMLLRWGVVVWLIYSQGGPSPP
jgi:putative effector of murein hydrolase LrgA (UPF0299 family)